VGGREGGSKSQFDLMNRLACCDICLSLSDSVASVCPSVRLSANPPVCPSSILRCLRIAAKGGAAYARLPSCPRECVFVCVCVCARACPSLLQIESAERRMVLGPDAEAKGNEAQDPTIFCASPFRDQGAKEVEYLEPQMSPRCVFARERERGGGGGGARLGSVLSLKTLSLSLYTHPNCPRATRLHFVQASGICAQGVHPRHTCHFVTTVGHTPALPLASHSRELLRAHAAGRVQERSAHPCPLGSRAQLFRCRFFWSLACAC
jgi:hypothetical protein